MSLRISTYIIHFCKRNWYGVEAKGMRIDSRMGDFMELEDLFLHAVDGADIKSQSICVEEGSQPDSCERLTIGNK
jgi:hypothetical protein